MSLLVKLSHLLIHFLKWKHSAKTLPVVCLHRIDCTLRQKPTEQSNIQLLKASVTNSVAISPKDSAPAKHNHTQQSRLFLCHFVKMLKMEGRCLCLCSVLWT